MNTADGPSFSAIVLQYAPAPESRRLYFRLLSLLLRLTIAVGTGALVYALTQTRYLCSAVLDVKHAEIPGFGCFGPVRTAYSAPEQKELEWVRRAACETARSAAFRRGVTEALVGTGVERRDAAALSDVFRVESLNGSRMIFVSVLGRDRTLLRRAAETVMVKLVGRHGKIVIDPIQLASAPTGHKPLLPAFVAMGLAVLAFVVESSVRSSRRTASPAFDV